MMAPSASRLHALAIAQSPKLFDVLLLQSFGVTVTRWWLLASTIRLTLGWNLRTTAMAEVPSLGISLYFSFLGFRRASCSSSWQFLQVVSKFSNRSSLLLPPRPRAFLWCISAAGRKLAYCSPSGITVTVGFWCSG